LETLITVPCLTRKDLARHLGCSLRTIDRLRKKGRLPKPFHCQRPLWRAAILHELDHADHE
jgi:hypothetical protein